MHVHTGWATPNFFTHTYSVYAQHKKHVGHVNSLGVIRYVLCQISLQIAAPHYSFICPRGRVGDWEREGGDRWPTCVCVGPFFRPPPTIHIYNKVHFSLIAVPIDVHIKIIVWSPPSSSGNANISATIVKRVMTSVHGLLQRRVCLTYFEYLRRRTPSWTLTFPMEYLVTKKNTCMTNVGNKEQQASQRQCPRWDAPVFH